MMRPAAVETDCQCWVKLPRSIAGRPWFADPIATAVYIRLLLGATHRPMTAAGRELMPGQLVITQRGFAEATGVTRSQFRTALNRLCETGDITAETAGHQTLVTIANYGSPKKSPNISPNQNRAQRPENQTRINQHSSDSPNISPNISPNTPIHSYLYNKNNKKDHTHYVLTNSKTQPSNPEASQCVCVLNYSFSCIWELYDKKAGNQTETAQRWAALTDQEREAIMQYVPRYKETSPNKRYRKRLIDFITQRTWEDEIIDYRPKAAPAPHNTPAQTGVSKGGFTDSLSFLDNQ